MSAPKIPAVEFRSVSKRFGSYMAVEDVSLAIEKGALVTLLGPSGCGKTTILRLIAGLESVSSGTILVNGEDVTHRPPAARDVGMVFQSYALFPHMSVLRNVAYGLLASGSSARQAEAQAAEALALVGLRGLNSRLPSELSGGQQQRVALARAIVLEPAVLLFDEPLSNLDVKLRRRLREEIRDLQQRLGLTAIYVTHDQAEALALSDRIVIVRGGRIAQEGSPEEIYRNPTSRFTAEFVGDANVVDVAVKSAAGGFASIQLGGYDLRLPFEGQRQRATKLSIRPEAIALHAAGDGSAGLAGSILRRAFLGSYFEYEVSTAAGRLFVVDRDVQRTFQIGQPVSATFRPFGVSLIADSGDEESGPPLPDGSGDG